MQIFETTVVREVWLNDDTNSFLFPLQVALRRFTPDQRRCYINSEFGFKYLPKELYRLGSDYCDNFGGSLKMHLLDY